MTTYTIPQGHRCDWWRIVQDLQLHMSVQSISDVTGIPKATLLGYKNQGAEPKHADGQRLIVLWQERMVPPLPMVEGTTRARRIGD